MAPQNNKPKPVTTLRCSSIQASIWKNSESFGFADLEALLVVVQQAKVWISEHSSR